MKLLYIDLLDEIFRFTDKPPVVLYFKKYITRQTIRVLYKGISIDKQAKQGNLQTIKYLHLIGAKCTTDAMDWASNHGFLDIVKYLHETVGAKCTEYAMDWASNYGFLDVVKYLHETVNAKCTTDAMDWASENGFLEVVKYLHETVGSTCTNEGMTYTCNYGRHNVVKYLHETVGVKFT